MSLVNEKAFGHLVVLKALKQLKESYPSQIGSKIGTTHSWVVQSLKRLKSFGLVEDVGRTQSHNYRLTVRGLIIYHKYCGLIDKVKELNEEVG